MQHSKSRGSERLNYFSTSGVCVRVPDLVLDVAVSGGLL